MELTVEDHIAPVDLRVGVMVGKLVSLGGALKA